MAVELTSSQIAGASFRKVRKGYDREEVDAFLGLAAQALEAAQQQATAMEARARAAVARLQESTAATPEPSPAVSAPVEPPTAEPAVSKATESELKVSRDEVETISRTLLLAQRAADTAVAEAESEAERIRTEARTEVEATIDSTREMSAQLLEEAKSEARNAGQAERQAAENEVQSLKARREFLVGDVDQLETFLVDQRERLRGAARQIEALVERVPSGLGQVRPPALSASDDEPGDDTAELFIPPEAAGPFAGVDELAKALDQGATRPIPTVDLSLTSDDGGGESDASAEDLPVRGGNPTSD